MQTARQYLNHLASSSRSRHDAWWLVSERTGTEESRRAKLRATLAFFGQTHKAADLESLLSSEPLTADLSPDLRGVVEQIAQDLGEYMLPPESESFRRTGFGLLPLSAVDAFCVDRTLWGTKLDGYLVVLNEGLFLCAQLLAKAFLLENLDGDLLQYRRSGQGAYQTAIEHFLAPSSIHANSVFFAAVPPGIEGALAAAQMNMTVVLLQFVMLHEMGHVVHQDHALMDTYQFHVAAATSQLELTDKFWAAEYAADRYALDRILRRAGSQASRWANFMAIYVFFHWLGAVERATGKPLCPLHPPPLMRGDALYTLVREHVPMDDSTYSLVKKSFDILRSWVTIR